MLQLHDGSRELKVVNDKLGTPTYTRDFAHNVRLLLERRWWGLYNMVCQGETSRLEVAQVLVRKLGLQESVRIRPVDSDFFADVYFAPRPACERLATGSSRCGAWMSCDRGKKPWLTTSARIMQGTSRST